MLWLKQKLTALLGAALAMVVLLTFAMVVLGAGETAAAFSTGVGIVLFGSVPVLLISGFSDWLAPRFGKGRKWAALLLHVGLAMLLTYVGVQHGRGLPAVGVLMLVFWWLDESIRHPKLSKPS